MSNQHLNQQQQQQQHNELSNDEHSKRYLYNIIVNRKKKTNNCDNNVNNVNNNINPTNNNNNVNPTNNNNNNNKPQHNIKPRSYSFSPFPISVYEITTPNNNSVVYTYGDSVFSYCLELDSFIFPSSFLSKHSLSKHARMRMVDWMIEIFCCYNSEPGCFFLSVHLFDLYLLKTSRHIYDEDIHLIGLGCIFLASKMEDIIPLQIYHIKTKIGHDKFTEKEILQMEKDILHTLDFDIVYVSTYDFIRTILFDLYSSSKELIDSSGMKGKLIHFEQICIYLVKMLCLNEEFLKYQKLLVAICCLVVAYDLLRSNKPGLNAKEEVFIKNWIGFVLKGSGYCKERIAEVFEGIVSFYQRIQWVESVAPNLNKHYGMVMMNKNNKGNK